MKMIINGILYVPADKQGRASETCPHCGSLIYYKVIDSRDKDGIRIRRKRCIKCDRTWRTAEYLLEEAKDGR